jgi:hypothetical protein
MRDELDALVVGEALACRFEHELREVEADTMYLAAIDPEKGEQTTVARPEVEDATSLARHLLDQDALSLRAARRGVRSGQVALGVLGGRPLLSCHAPMLAWTGPASRRLTCG